MIPVAVVLAEELVTSAVYASYLQPRKEIVALPVAMRVARHTVAIVDLIIVL